MALFKEAWLNTLEGKLFAENIFLQHGKDMTSLIEYDTINSAAIGMIGPVQKNLPLGYSLAVYQAADVPLSITLDNYMSGTQLIQDIETVSLVYDKMRAYVDEHKLELNDKIAADALWEIGPVFGNNTTAITNTTPVLETTGATNAYGRKALTLADVAKLATYMNRLNVPTEGRVLLLSPEMYEDLQTTTPSFNQVSVMPTHGNFDLPVLRVAGFEIHTRVQTPHYSGSAAGYTKLAYGAIPAATDNPSAVAYVKNKSWCRALGTIKMFEEVSATRQGDLISFLVRAKVWAFQQKNLAAIVQVV
jgi:hypothetical protein